MKLWRLLIGTLVTASAGGGAAEPAGLGAALAETENQPRYRPADWGYCVLDQETGEVVVAQNANHLFDPGSTMKTYAVSTALRLYGADYRFRTPVYRAGDVTGGSLDGNLVLVGSGDLCLGLREQPNGTLYYENMPEFDQSYATLGLPGAVEPRQFAGAPSLTFVFTEFNQTGRSANEDLVVKRTGNVNMTALTCVFPGGGTGSASRIAQCRPRMRKRLRSNRGRRCPRRGDRLARVPQPRFR